ncbi:MAG: 50S ribosomal protein L18 [Clostridiales bacterium]|nr:50S ribosomal protein L18 [Clostridiales bacterium]
MKRTRNDNRVKRHERVRKTVFGTPERPRLCVFRSSKNIYAQIIDDVSGNTLASACSLDAELKDQLADCSKKEAAKLVGKRVGEVAKDAGISTVVFDRGGYLYHGRVKELAEGAREAGLEF